MYSTLLNIVITILALILGFYILTSGRRFLWATSGVIMTAASANLLSILIAGGERGWDLVERGQWQLSLIALGIGLVGVLLGRFAPVVAIASVGFLAGADIAHWFTEMLVYLFNQIATLPGNVALWIGIGLLFVGGLPGLYWTQRYPHRAVIIISVLVGLEMINMALGLSPTSNFSAVILLALALLGVVVQYAEYARETQKRAPFGELGIPVDVGLDPED